MAKIRPPFTVTALIIFLLLAATAPAPTHSVYISHFHSILSLTQSLLTRVSNLRAERGDISGANRAKFISQTLQLGLWFGSWGSASSIGREYVKNYSWRELDYRELYGVVSDLIELRSSLSELLRVDSEKDMSVYLSHFHSILSLTHSLLTRVSNLRAERGDISGANRAKFISQKLQLGLWFGSWGSASSFGRDYVKNYAWRELDYRELYGVVSDLNELTSSLSELLRADSKIDMVARVSQSYGKILVVSKRLFVRLLHVFRQSGPLREVVEALKIELVDGDLLRDCLEIGSNDFKASTQIIKDIALLYNPKHSS